MSEPEVCSVPPGFELSLIIAPKQVGVIELGVTVKLPPALLTSSKV
ncbi:hypothetical protein LNJ08_06030 [Tenacibaculum finnmarkense genomovar ulcerans]|nr:hypothetical protein [Tenacibaculum finnmarkense]MCD8453947.1 hypothetical protein [Tenacibaculum finnmarkense genomovar ulcerans]